MPTFPLSSAAILVSALVTPLPVPVPTDATFGDVALASWTGDVLSGEVGGVWAGTTPPADTDIALVLGPTGISQPEDTYLQAVYTLYLQPSGIFDGASSDVYSLYTPENSGNTVVGLGQDQEHILAALLPLLENGNHVTLFGYSQSAAAVSLTLNDLSAEYGPEYADQVSFVLVGDSAAPQGVLNNIYESLPTWMQPLLLQNLEGWGLNGMVTLPGSPSLALTPSSPYEGAVFTLVDGGTDNPSPDGYAMWGPDSVTDGSWWSQLAGMFSTHEAYLGVSPDSVAQALDTPDVLGSVSYYDIDPDLGFFELLTHSAAAAGFLPTWLADALLGDWF